MIKNIYAFFACAFLSSSAFGLGVGVDSVQAEPKIDNQAKLDAIEAAQDALDDKKNRVAELKDALEKLKFAELIAATGNTQGTKIIDSGSNAFLNDGQDLVALSPANKAALRSGLADELVQAEDEVAQKQETVVAAKATLEEGGEVVVDPQVSAGEGDPSAKVNFRYTYNFGNSAFFTSAVEIGSSPDDTPDNLAAAFATNGGNVDFSLSGGRSWFLFSAEDIRFTPSFTFTYSGFTASELDLESGGTAEVDTEVQSSTLSVTLAFEKKYFLSVGHSYHEVLENDATEFSDLLDHERTTVVRAIFAVGGDTDRLLVLERAHPIGNESAQLRLSFITSLNF